jgi:hypothetical protein
MDPTPLFTEAVKLGFVVVLLLAAVIGLIQWVKGLEAARTAREAQDRIERKERDAQARQECIEREQALANRLTIMENRSHGEIATLLTSAVSALESNATALKRLTDEDSGLQLALLNGLKSRD